MITLLVGITTNVVMFFAGWCLRGMIIPKTTSHIAGESQEDPRLLHEWWPVREIAGFRFEVLAGKVAYGSHGRIDSCRIVRLHDQKCWISDSGIGWHNEDGTPENVGARMDLGEMWRGYMRLLAFERAVKG
jgi:hypothetical protein